MDIIRYYDQTLQCRNFITKRNEDVTVKRINSRLTLYSFLMSQNKYDVDLGILYYRPLHSAHKSLDWRLVLLKGKN